MGFDCELTYSHKFIYKVELDNNLIEHEWDHVLVGYYNDNPEINPSEAMNWKFMALDALQKDAVENPQHYTTWFKMILQQPELSNLQIA